MDNEQKTTGRHALITMFLCGLKKIRDDNKNSKTNDARRRGEYV